MNSKSEPSQNSGFNFWIFWLWNSVALGLSVPINLLIGYGVLECVSAYTCGSIVSKPYLLIGLTGGLLLIVSISKFVEKQTGFSSLWWSVTSIFHLIVPQFFFPFTPNLTQIGESGLFSPLQPVIVLYIFGVVCCFVLRKWKW